jgi:hypothetical protein
MVAIGAVLQSRHNKRVICKVVQRKGLGENFGIIALKLVHQIAKSSQGGFGRFVSASACSGEVCL